MSSPDLTLLAMLVCPETRGPLRYDVDRQELISLHANLAYPIRHGVPTMLRDEARVLTEEEQKRYALMV